ncbi:unnamed protein product [Anisakis simplex]|uniref:SER_THR_PHOSPHATASE domain-containing protein n=1 Tax=Anisakis simplex TaxID=6269 RepID=A0A0M3JT71_ANISI|nr:unnamed protein product [Anisakis simplex]
MTQNDEENTAPKTVNLTANMTGNGSDVDVLIHNIWSYILDNSDEIPPTYEAKYLLAVLDKAERILEQEPTVLDLQGPLTIIGDIQGHGDSLLTLFSLTSKLSNQRFLLLGNYSGNGFASHECLFLLLALKIRYPRKIFLLRGNMEECENAKAHFFIEGLAVRNLMTTVLIWLSCERIFGLFPLAASVDNRLFCCHGGIGQYTLIYGIKTLRNIQRPPVLPKELAITKELLWSCYDSNGDENESKDNVPHFNDIQIEDFCLKNSFRMIIRSRQLVYDGILNVSPRLMIIWSAVSFLDSFNNAAAALVLDESCEKGTVFSYSLYECEPKSLDDTKPAGGRSSLAGP